MEMCVCAPDTYRYDGASVIDSDQLIQLCNIYMRRASYEKPLYLTSTGSINFGPQLKTKPDSDV